MSEQKYRKSNKNDSKFVIYKNFPVGTFYFLKKSKPDIYTKFAPF
jgi:hypothetical protein